MNSSDKLETVWKHPGKCIGPELKMFHDMVLIGGEVDPDQFMDRIERAERLVFCNAGEFVVGVAGLKCAGKNYRKRTGEKAKLDLSEKHWPWEFGWVFVCPGARGRGVSHRLVACALDGINEPIFATSRADNSFMHSPLKAAGFEQAGEQYISDRHGGPMLVFIRAGQAVHS